MKYWPRRIDGDWFHWGVGNSLHFGFFIHSNDWYFFSWPKRKTYMDGELVAYSWWRFFLMIG